MNRHRSCGGVKVWELTGGETAAVFTASASVRVGTRIIIIHPVGVTSDDFKEIRDCARVHYCVGCKNGCTRYTGYSYGRMSKTCKL